VTRVRLRAATREDLSWVRALARDPAVEPSLARGAAEGLSEAIARGELLVAERPGDGERVGALRLVVTHERHGHVALRTVMVAPEAQGSGVGLAIVQAAVAGVRRVAGLRRIEAEVYGFNAAGLRLFERAGFTREGVRRRAWNRHGAWQDGIMYALLTQDR
jgi:RimJ/RimL family protein N-acetyltransferase